MTVLRELARQAIRYGLKPEDIGPVSTFADLEYMKGYIRHIRGFEAPASYGVSAVHRERARWPGGVRSCAPDRVLLRIGDECFPRFLASIDVSPKAAASRKPPGRER